MSDDPTNRTDELRRLAAAAQIVAETTADPNRKRALQALALKYKRLANFVLSKVVGPVSGTLKGPRVCQARLRHRTFGSMTCFSRVSFDRRVEIVSGSRDAPVSKRRPGQTAPERAVVPADKHVDAGSPPFPCVLSNGEAWQERADDTQDTPQCTRRGG